YAGTFRIVSVGVLYLFSLTSFCFFFSSRRRHTRSKRDWSSDVCSSDLYCVIDQNRAGCCRFGPVGPGRSVLGRVIGFWTTAAYEGPHPNNGRRSPSPSRCVYLGGGNHCPR